MDNKQHWIERVKNGYATVGAGWLKESDTGARVSVKIEHARDLPVDENGNANLTIFRNDNATGNQPTHRISCKIPDGYSPDRRSDPPPKSDRGQASFGGKETNRGGW